MKGIVAFLFFLLFLAAYALISLRGGRVSPDSTAGELTQTRWSVSAVEGMSVASSSGAVVEFGDGNRVSGSGGCNFFSGSYARDADGFRVSSLRATRKACEPEAMQLEQRLFAALGKTRSAVLDDETLRLEDAAGTSLIRLDRAPQ